MSCAVCGEWYDRPDRDTLDICPDCYTRNFAQSQELREDAPVVTPSLTLTPLQVQAMRRLHERWQARSEAAIRQWEDG